MSGIFISYRRVDTIAWAGRLFADLTKCFGKSQVFMDINGGIPRGADFEKTLTEALAGCDALLALIGPQWLSCVDDQGRRRLDSPQDWVRNEIITALAARGKSPNFTKRTGAVRSGDFGSQIVPERGLGSK